MASTSSQSVSETTMTHLDDPPTFSPSVAFGDEEEYEEEEGDWRQKLESEATFRRRSGTAIVSFSMVCIGASLSLLSLVLPDIESSSWVVKSLIFPSTFGAFLTGSLFARVAFSPSSPLSAYRVMSLSLVILAIALSLLPLVSIEFYWLAFVTFFFLGFAAAFLDSGGNVIMGRLWYDQYSKYVHVIYFTYGLGSILTPIVMLFSQNIFQSSHPGFWVIAGLSFIFCLPFVFIKSPPTEGAEEVPVRWHSNFLKSFYVLQFFLFLFFYAGAEVSFSGWLFTFAKDSYNFSRDSAYLLSAAFWAALTFGRLCGILLARFLKPVWVLSIDFVGAASCLLVMIFIRPGSNIVLGCGTVGLGLFLSTVFSSTTSLPTSLRIPLSSKDSIWLIIGAVCGEMTMPVIVSNFYPHATDFFWLVLASLVMSFICFVGILTSWKMCPPPRNRDNWGGDNFGALELE